MEQAPRDKVTRRRLEREFVARGLASRDEARRVSEYCQAESVHAELGALLVSATGSNAKQ